MVVTLKKPLNDYGYNWPASTTVEVSMKFYRKLIAEGYIDPHPEDPAHQPAPKASKAKAASAPAPEPPSEIIEE